MAVRKIVKNSHTEVSVTPIRKFESGTVSSNAGETEDDFNGLYFDGTVNSAGRLIRPTYDIGRLQELVTQNNALLSCISAMEVNIDGTGYDIKKIGDDTPTADEQKRIAAVMEFFNNPYPRKSFITIRRALRVDIESTGNAYLEIIRNIAGMIIYIRRVNPKFMRLVKLGDAIPVKKTVIRGGNQFEVTLMDRPRAFAQKINTKLTFFREYGLNTHINRITGEWDNTGSTPVELRGNEIIHFTMIEDDKSPYGLPRWINQIPSVIGSRNAEEYNLEFFENGGIPPVVVTVSGGAISVESRKVLDNLFNGAAKYKLRGAVVETHAVGGDLSSTNKVDVKVERFGNEQVSDSMFEKYDDKCERRIRSAFRLPPLFVGKADDYSYATAYASYAIGEAQVFKPERLEFDEIINKTIMQEFDTELVLVSKPLTIDNSEIQLKAVEVAANNKVIGGEGLVTTLNKMTNLHLEYDEASTLPGKQPTQAQQAGAAGVPAGKEPVQTMKSEGNQYLQGLADRWVVANGLDGGAGSKKQAASIQTQIDGLIPLEKSVFNKLVAVRVLGDITNDVEGCVDLCECAAHVTGA